MATDRRVIGCLRHVSFSVFEDIVRDRRRAVEQQGVRGAAFYSQ